MTRRHSEPRARYSVDIRGLSVHAEVDELVQILGVVDGHAGMARVIDSRTNALVFHGTMDALREKLHADFAPATEESCDVAL